MAEAVFKHLVADTGLTNQFFVDSVGTAGYHTGDLAHPRTRQVLAQHGITCESVSRQITRADMDNADYIIAMDRQNLSDLRYMASNAGVNGQHMRLLLEFAPNSSVRDVPDPYYSGNFEEVYRLVEAGCRGLLAHIQRQQEF